MIELWSNISRERLLVRILQCLILINDNDRDHRGLLDVSYPYTVHDKPPNQGYTMNIPFAPVRWRCRRSFSSKTFVPKIFFALREISQPREYTKHQVIP